MVSRTRFMSHRSGAIEGLPLYLIIIIVITVIGLGVVLAMMNTVEPPSTIKTITITPDVIEVKDSDDDDTYTVDESGKTVSVKVKVVDSNGDSVKGAVVRLTGCDVKSDDGTAYGKTGSDGTITFDNIDCQVVGTDTGHIDVEVEKSGLGKKTGTISVIPVT